jgi:hypothetical protein
MGDLSIAQDLIDGVADAMADLGASRTVRIFTEGALTPGDPGAGGARTPENLSVEALLYDYEDQYIDETTVLSGDRKAIISIGPLTVAQIGGIEPGSLLVDGADIYTIVKTGEIEVAGVVVTMILQIRGA